MSAIAPTEATFWIYLGAARGPTSDRATHWLEGRWPVAPPRNFCATDRRAALRRCRVAWIKEPALINLDRGAEIVSALEAAIVQAAVI
jgi:hypothetical protein